MPSPCSAESGDRLAEAEREGFVQAADRPRGPRPCWRPAPPAPSTGAASGRFPRRAGSARRAHRSRTARRRRRPARPRSARASGRAGCRRSSSSQPAVSTMVKSSPSRCASPKRRSRVTPGWSSTSASFLPTSRLNSVDLPTLGRPMMMTWGSMVPRKWPLAPAAWQAKRQNVAAVLTKPCRQTLTITGRTAAP